MNTLEMSEEEVKEIKEKAKEWLNNSFLGACLTSVAIHNLYSRQNMFNNDEFNSEVLHICSIYGITCPDGLLTQ